jgi:hypothetical protein
LEPRTTITGSPFESSPVSIACCNKLFPLYISNCFGLPNREDDPAASITMPVRLVDGIYYLELSFTFSISVAERGCITSRIFRND